MKQCNNVTPKSPPKFLRNLGGLTGQAIQRGVAIYLAIVIVFVLLGIGLGISTILVGQIKMIRGVGYSVVAFYAADTGIERELKEKNPAGTTYSGFLDLNNNGVQDADDSTYTVKILDAGEESCPSEKTIKCIQSLGIYQGVRRALRITVPAMPCVSPDQYTVFVSSVGYSGSQVGPNGAAADALCQGLADTAGIGGDKKYTAWISDRSFDEPRDRGLKACVKTGGVSASWYLPDGITKVADNWNDLTDGSIDNSINLDENGNPASSDYVWTATDRFGAAMSRNCVSWTSDSSGDDGTIGRSNRANFWWTNSSHTACSGGRLIYCFQYSE